MLNQLPLHHFPTDYVFLIPSEQRIKEFNEGLSNGNRLFNCQYLHEWQKYQTSIQNISRNYNSSPSDKWFSKSIKNLTLNLAGDIIDPLPDELQLNILLENLEKCFPNLKNVEICLDFSDHHESRRPAEDKIIEVYTLTYHCVMQQINEARINYNLSLEWIWPFCVISNKNNEFAAKSEALIGILGFQKLENDGNLHTYKSEKQISENKKFKMEAFFKPNVIQDQRFPEIDMDYYNFSDIDDEEIEDYDDED